MNDQKPLENVEYFKLSGSMVKKLCKILPNGCWVLPGKNPVAFRQRDKGGGSLRLQLMKDVQVKLNPGLSCQKQHSTGRRFFSLSDST
jgi:hypothetical protein